MGRERRRGALKCAAHRRRGKQGRTGAEPSRASAFRVRPAV